MKMNFLFVDHEFDEWNYLYNIKLFDDRNQTHLNIQVVTFKLSLINIIIDF